VTPQLRAVHRLALLACFVAVAGLALGSGMAWLARAKLGRPPVVFDYARMMSKRLPEIAAARGEAYTIAMLGDSSLVSYPPGESVS